MSRRSRSARRSPVANQGASARGASTLWLRLAVIVFAGALAYSNSLSGPFLLDDNLSIVTSPHIRGFFPIRTLLFPERESPVAGRPLVNISFAVNYAMGGLDVRGYHVFNIAIHILVALLFFGIVRRTLDSARLRARFGRHSANLALAAALIWVVHPLNTETVNYLTQRTESLMSLFYLLTLYASVRANGAQQSTFWPVVSVVSCAFGMACKESMATVPVMVMLYDRIFTFDSLRDALRSRWKLYACLAATGVIVIALISTGPRIRSTGFSTDVTLWGYLLNQTLMITHYLRLAVWPSGLVVDYGVPLDLSLSDVFPYGLFVVGLLSLTLVALRLNPPAGFLGAWFFITLAPASSIVPIATVVGAEHRMYLPLMAVVLLLLFGVVLIWQRLAVRVGRDSSQPYSSWVAKFALFAITTSLGVATMVRNREYSSLLTIAQTVLDRRPTGQAHHFMAVALLDAGRREEALVHLRQAIPGDPRALYSLGLELFRNGKLDEAIVQLETFIREEPLRLEVLTAHTTIGNALLKQGKPAEAAEHFAKVLQMVPSFGEAHQGLGDALLAQEKYKEAITHYREYLKGRPNDVGTLSNLGIVLAADEQPDEALVVFRRVADLDPQSSASHRNLANALLQKQLFDEAATHARQASALNPADAVAHNILGLALIAQRKVDEAIVAFERSLQIDAGDEEARANLTQARQIRRALAGGS